jgi:ribosomal protein L7/L12
VPAQPYVDPRAGEVPPDVVMLARSGKKIEAIKRYRELTNADLKTAKNVVDRI